MQSTVRTEQPCINMPDLAQLKSLIDSSFTHDWVLRIEHTDETRPSSSSWQQWGKTAFAVRDATQVMDNIAGCRRNHPTHSIRLHAEKLKPRTRMLYCVYRAQGASARYSLAADASSAAATANHTRTAGNNWMASVAKAVESARSRIWRMATLVGMLLASLLFIEEVMA